jgi:hypothetical protein
LVTELVGNVVADHVREHVATQGTDCTWDSILERVRTQVGGSR